MTVLDVAAYILQEQGSMTAMKLQKLVFYSQAWHTVWEDELLFEEPIQAWANGPVAPALYEQHRGRFQLRAGDIPGNPAALSKDEISTIDAVLETYGDKSAQWLSELTHSEAPWVEARRGIPDGERGSVEITPAAMVEYYGSL